MSSADDPLADRVARVVEYNLNTEGYIDEAHVQLHFSNMAAQEYDPADVREALETCVERGTVEQFNDDKYRAPPNADFLDAVRALRDRDEAATTEAVARKVGRPTATARDRLADMADEGAVDREESDDETRWSVADGGDA